MLDDSEITWFDSETLLWVALTVAIVAGLVWFWHWIDRGLEDLMP